MINFWIVGVAIVALIALIVHGVRTPDEVKNGRNPLAGDPNSKNEYPNVQKFTDGLFDFFDRKK